MRGFLAIGLMALLAILAGVPAAMAQGVAASSSLQAPAKADEDAFYALGKQGDDIIFPLQKKMFADLSDKARFCADATQITAASQDRVQKAIAFLRKLMTDGKSPASLESTLLVWSDSADNALKTQLEQCAEAKYPDNDDAQTVLYLKSLLAAYDTAKAGKLKAQATGDRLAYLVQLQTMHILLKDVLDYLDLLQRFGATGSPQLNGIVAQGPALKSEYTALHDKYQRKIAPILHPGGRDEDAPFAYRPIATPDVASDDDTFLRRSSDLMLSALMPLNGALRPGLLGDYKSACANARFARSDMQQVQAYAKAYLTKRTEAGADTTAATKLVRQLDDLSTKIDDSVNRMCELYRSSGASQSLYDDANAGLTAASAKQDPAVEALQTTINAHDVAGQCKASRDLLAVVDQKMVSLQLIEALVEPESQNADKAAYLAKINDIYDKTKGLLLQIIPIEAKTCPAAVVADMTLD